MQSDRAKVAILKVLHDMNGPAGGSRITDRLLSMGLNLQPRTIRLYLLQMDREGLTRFVSRRRGREITKRGQEELAHANVIEKVGFVAAKVDTLGYQMSFSNRSGKGTIIMNIAMIRKRNLSRVMAEMEPVFARRLGMGMKLALVRGGHTLGNIVVPKDSVALGTVCSVTVNGILLHEGIPVTSRFGGLVEIRDEEPVRFVELIEYSGTTLDPLEAFIRAGMTQVRECARKGSGIIGASFREIPSVAIDSVRRIEKGMETHGLAGILALGKPNQPLLDIPVAEGRAGMIVTGGLNPIAAVHEAGIQVTMKSLVGLEDINTFTTFQEVFATNN